MRDPLYPVTWSCAIDRPARTSSTAAPTKASTLLVLTRNLRGLSRLHSRRPTLRDGANVTRVPISVNGADSQESHRPLRTNLVLVASIGDLTEKVPLQPVPSSRRKTGPGRIACGPAARRWSPPCPGPSRTTPGPMTWPGGTVSWAGRPDTWPIATGSSRKRWLGGCET